MRISGGVARGITLVAPKGDRTRPATDGMRQAVFSSLGARVADARFLDLFAGSGAYGLEAISRGAASGVFVEQNAKAAACVRQNLLAVCKSAGRDAREFFVLQSDARSVPLFAGHSAATLRSDSPQTEAGQAGTDAASANSVVSAASAAVPDLVFIDPPYEIIPEIAPALFVKLTAALAPKPDAIVVFEFPGELELAPPGWDLLKRLGKGARQPTVGFFRRSSAGL